MTMNSSDFRLVENFLGANRTNSTHNMELFGYLGMVIASVFWGGNNLPVKHYETGDGMFFQLIVGIAVWSSGIIVHWIRGFPKFYAFPLLGGFFWATGNLQTVPVIRCVGIGIGSLFWNVSGLIVGWSYARFGWFGIKEEIPANITLNYIGVILTVISCIVLLFVKVDEQHLTKKNDDEEPVLRDDIDVSRMSDEISNISYEIAEMSDPSKDIFDRMNETQKRILGTFLSFFAGIMYGFSYMPGLYIQDNISGSSQNNNDYAFSMSTGIFLGSVFYFVIYCIYTKNNPKVYSELIFPSLVTGWLWGIANTAYFIATDVLSQSVTFPIANSGPAVVAFILGLFYREIKGRKNLFILSAGLFIAIAGIICCGLSYSS